MRALKSIFALGDLLRNPRFNVLSVNFIALFSIRSLGYVFPLIVMPYLVRVIGIDNYGLFSSALSVIAFVLIFVDYGFETIATRDVAAFRGSKQRIAQIFSEIFLIKAVLVILGFFVTNLVLAIFFPSRLDMIICYGVVVGQALSPTWLFRGFEDMKFVAFSDFFSKLIFFALVVTFVKSPLHYDLVLAFYSVSFIVSGGVTQLIALRRYSLKIIPFPRSEILYYLNSGFQVLSSRIFVLLYSPEMYIILLSVLATSDVVGVYSIAAKIIAVLANIFGMLSEVLLPYFSHLYSNFRSTFYKNFMRARNLLLIGSTVLALVIVILSPTIARLIIDESYNAQNLSRMLRYLSLVVLLSPLGPLYTIYFVVSQKYTLLLKITCITGLAAVITGFIFYKLVGVSGILLSNLLVQILISTLLYLNFDRVGSVE